MNQLASASASISIVCVYNDPDVRQDCLDRSLDRYTKADDPDPRIEYIPIDNINGTYKSAGAALNYGASVAKNDVVVFVHQDVYFHSVEAAIQAAQGMERGQFGVLGAVGIRSDGRFVGSVRDRTILLGDAVAEPTDVDSVDELLFMVPRQLLMREPLTESADMAWHAYAVEYGLRVRKLGLRVGVAHIPVTHNSLSTNTVGLDVAHARVAARYRDQLPIRTTCGVLSQRTIIGSHRAWLASQGSRYRRIAASLVAARNVHRHSNAPFLHADSRFEIDRIISRAPGQRLCIVNNISDKRFADDSLLELKRLGSSIFVVAREIVELPTIVDQCERDTWFLIADITFQDIQEVEAKLIRREHIIGFHASIGYWVLAGPGSIDLPMHLRKRRLSLHRQLRS